ASEAALVDLLEKTGQFGSKGEVRRLIKQGGIRIDGERVENPAIKVRRPEPAHPEWVVQAGKRRFVKVIDQ
ncbi:MAG: S4 domain-containing protein, partial [Verrucomicrobiota bacterium]